jgi:EMG1/NEP1 methyltransferase
MQVGNAFELLNCDDHGNALKKQNRDAGSCRPDIVHQCLLMLLDSPLNRAGLLQVCTLYYYILFIYSCRKLKQIKNKNEKPNFCHHFSTLKRFTLKFCLIIVIG